jgi:integrase/recombinase XerD
VEISDNVAGFKETRQMIESIFQLKWVVSRHKQAPLLNEREQFLAHCQQQGTSHKALHNLAPELIAVIRLLRLKQLREVSLEEIKEAAKVWAEEQRSNPRARSNAKSTSYFIFIAKKWLRFHGKLKIPSPPRARFADELDDFVTFMATEQRALADLHTIPSMEDIEVPGLVRQSAPAVVVGHFGRCR